MIIISEIFQDLESRYETFYNDGARARHFEKTVVHSFLVPGALIVGMWPTLTLSFISQ